MKILSSPLLSALMLAFALPSFAAPTLGDCAAADNPAGVAATCGTSFCSFDSGTGLLSCDNQNVCSSATTSLIVDRINGGASYDFVASATCGATTVCCTIEDTNNELDGFRLRGTNYADNLGFTYCQGGTFNFGTGLPNTPPTCSSSTIIGLFSHRVGITLTAELFGADGADLMLGFNLHDVLPTYRGNGGNDTILGGKDENDTIFGGLGNDTIYGFDGDDTIFGDDGNDTIFAGRGNDVCNGGNDDDEIHGFEGNDKLIDGDGDDELFGEEDDDILIGTNGSDSSFGAAGEDTLCEDDSADAQLAGDDDDVIWNKSGTAPFGNGGSGFDICTTGAGFCESTAFAKPVVCTI